MSKIFIVEDCTKCPNFIPCTSPKDFRVGCTKLGDLGSPLNLIGGGIPIDCPLNDYEEPKTGHWNSWFTEIKGNNTFNCMECGSTFIVEQGAHNMNYCPNCGCRMVEPQGSEDKE